MNINIPLTMTSVLDLIKMLEERFRILKRKEDTGRRLRIFERELSVSLQDVFFRELAAEGSFSK